MAAALAAQVEPVVLVQLVKQDLLEEPAVPVALEVEVAAPLVVQVELAAQEVLVAQAEPEQRVELVPAELEAQEVLVGLAQRVAQAELEQLVQQDRYCQQL